MIPGYLPLKLVYGWLFVGTLSSELTVIPGYLPLKLSIAQSMRSGADLAKYVLTLCHAVGDNTTHHYASHPHGNRHTISSR